MWENTVAIHSVLNKKNYKGKFLVNSILKKSTNIILWKKKMKKKIREKNKKKIL